MAGRYNQYRRPIRYETYEPVPGPVFNNNGSVGTQANTVGNGNTVDARITDSYNQHDYNNTQNYSGKFANFNAGEKNNSTNNLGGTFNM